MDNFEFDNLEPAFKLELGLHHVRRDLIITLDQSDHHECFDCQNLQCRCSTLSPTTSMSAITASSWSELDSCYTSAEDNSDGSFILVESENAEKQKKHKDEDEDVTEEEEDTSSSNGDLLDEAVAKEAQRKKLEEWAKSIVVSERQALNPSAWHNPTPPIIPFFEIPSSDFPEPIIPGPIIPEGIHINPMVPQFVPRGPWYCEPPVEDWLREPWVRQPWFRHPFHPELSASDPDPPFAWLPLEPNAPRRNLEDNNNLEQPPSPWARSWASLFLPPE